MDDDKNTEQLEGVSGGPDTVAPSITDALVDVDGGYDRKSYGGLGESEDDPLEDVDGGIPGAQGNPAGPQDPLDDIEGGGIHLPPVHPNA